MFFSRVLKSLEYFKTVYHMLKSRILLSFWLCYVCLFFFSERVRNSNCIRNLQRVSVSTIDYLIYKQHPPFCAKTCSDIFPRTLSVSRSVFPRAQLEVNCELLGTDNVFSRQLEAIASLLLLRRERAQRARCNIIGI